MKKASLLFISLFLITFILRAQSLATITFSPENENLPPLGGNFAVPVNVSGFPAQLYVVYIHINYDKTVLHYTGMSSVYGSLLKMTHTPTGIRLQYDDFPGSTNGPTGKIADLFFDYSGGDTPIDFTNESRYLTMGFQTIYITSHTDGAVLGGYLANSIVDGAWEMPSNWSLEVVPNAYHKVTVLGDATINSVAASHDLTIEQDAHLTIGYNGTLLVKAQLSNPQGSEGLLIESNYNGTGGLMNFTPGVEATLQRCLTGNSMAWHQFSSPVSILDFQNGFNDGTILSWFEPAQTWVSSANTSVWPTWNDVNVGDVFTPAKGYMISYPYVDGDPQTKVFTGVLNQGPFTFDLLRQAHPEDNFIGFNLMGNPYPSSIDWKASIGWDRSNLELTGFGQNAGYSYWVWNPVSGQYGTFHSGQASDAGTLGTTRYISTMQGFWVRAEQEGTLGMDNQVRSNTIQQWLKSSQAEPGILRLTVTGEANQYSDEVIMEFGHQASVGGSQKLFSLLSEAPSLYTTKDNINYSISFLEDADQIPSVPLAFKAGVNGNYTLSVTGLEYFELVELEDLLTGIRHPLTVQNFYQFQASTGDDASRFVLHFKALGIEDQVATQPYAFYRKGEIVVFNPWQGPATLFVFDASGRVVKDKKLHGLQQHSVAFDAVPGFYVIALQSNTNISTFKLVVPR